MLNINNFIYKIKYNGYDPFVKFRFTLHKYSQKGKYNTLTQKHKAHSKMSINHYAQNSAHNFERKRIINLEENHNKENTSHNTVSEKANNIKNKVLPLSNNVKTRRLLQNISESQDFGTQGLKIQNWQRQIEVQFNLQIQGIQITQSIQSIKMDQEVGQCEKVKQKIMAVFNNMSLSQKSSIKQQNSQKISKEYSYDILLHLLHSTEKNFHFLQQHNVSQNLRSKMIDWMIEVCASYKISDQGYFKSVYYMDKYFKKNPKKIEAKQVHLIGICCMFLAAKMEQIYPFRIKTICQKISRSKFSKKEVIAKESQILQILNFDLQVVSIFPIIQHILYLMKKERILIEYRKFQQATELHFKLVNQRLLRINQFGELQTEIEKFLKQKIQKIQKAFQFLHKVCTYLAKMTRYSYKLSETPVPFVAAGVIHVGLKTTQQLYDARQKMQTQSMNKFGSHASLFKIAGDQISTFDSDYYLRFMLLKMNIKEIQITQISASVLALAQNFSREYPSLQNLNRFNRFE